MIDRLTERTFLTTCHKRLHVYFTIQRSTYIICRIVSAMHQLVSCWHAAKLTDLSTDSESGPQLFRSKNKNVSICSFVRSYIRVFRVVTYLPLIRTDRLRYMLAMRSEGFYVFTHYVPLYVPLSRANMDSSAGQASPLHTYCSRGIIWPSAVLSSLVQTSFFLSPLGWHTLPSHASAEACLTGWPVCNPMEGTSVVLRDTIKLTYVRSVCS